MSTIRIDLPEQAAQNFAEWFRKEGLSRFMFSPHNHAPDADREMLITALAGDEELMNLKGKITGHLFELE